MTKAQDATGHKFFIELPGRAVGEAPAEKVPLENEAYLCDRFMAIHQ